MGISNPEGSFRVLESMAVDRVAEAVESGTDELLDELNEVNKEIDRLKQDDASENNEADKEALLALDTRQFELQTELFIEKFDSLLEELTSIGEQVELFDLRREELLGKTVLSSDEQEELRVLIHIKWEVEKLGTMITEFLEDRQIDKEFILRTSRADLMVRHKEIFELSNIEILETSYRLGPQETAALKGLTLSNEDVQAYLNLYGEPEPEFIRTLLTHCTLSPSQRNMVLSDIPHDFVSPQMLSLLELKLPRSSQDQIIRVFEEQMESNPFEIESYMSLDILKSEYLSSSQKNRLAKTLVEIGNGGDCAFIKRNYSRYLSADVRAAMDEKIRYDFYLSSQSGAEGLDARALFKSNPEELNEKPLQVVVHPLWAPFFQMDFDGALWVKVEKDGLKYVEQKIIQSMQSALNEAEDGKVSRDYFLALEMMQEYDLYKSLLADESKRSLFLLPRMTSSDRLMPGTRAYLSALNSIVGPEDFYTETLKRDSGAIRERDQSILKSSLGGGQDIEVSGGLIGQCLSMATSSLMKISPTRIVVDHTDSVPDLTVGGNYSLNEPRFIDTSDYEEKNVSFIVNDSTINSLEDVKRVIANNRELNEAYQRENYREKKDGYVYQF
jgi:hypothetical protein